MLLYRRRRRRRRDDDSRTFSPNKNLSTFCLSLMVNDILKFWRRGPFREVARRKLSSVIR